MTYRMRVVAAMLLAVATTSPALTTVAATPNSCPASATWQRGTWPTSSSSSQPLNTEVASWTALRDASGSLLVSDGVTISRSIDGGCSWTPVFDMSTATSGSSALSGLPDAYFVAGFTTPAYPGDPNRVYALVEPTGYLAVEAYLPVLVAESTDAGRTWTLHDGVSSLTSGPQCNPGVNVTPAVAVSSPDILYLVCLASGAQQTSAGEAVFRSADGGVTWTGATAPFSPGFGPVMAIDPANASSLYFATRASTGNGAPDNVVVFHTLDAGAHWTPQIVEPAVGDGAPVGIDTFRRGRTTTVLVYSTVGGVVETSDGAVSWHRIGRLVHGGPFVVGAQYLAPSGDIAVWEQVHGFGDDGALAAGCGSAVTLTIYRGARRIAHHEPPMTTPWGRVAGFSNDGFAYVSSRGDAMHEGGNSGPTFYLANWYVAGSQCPRGLTLLPLLRFKLR